MPNMLRDVHINPDFDPADLAVVSPWPRRLDMSAPNARPNRSAQPDPHAEWINRIHDIRVNRSEAAFVALFEHFAPRLKAFLMKSGSDAATAEEIVQDAMSTVWRKAHLFDPTRANVSTWIFTIARNRRIDLLRKSKRPEPEDLPWGPEHEPDAPDVIEFQQTAERLGEAMKQLPEKQRTLVEKAYFGELTHSEIAAETGLPLGTIKSRIRLALDRLRHAMS